MLNGVYKTNSTDFTKFQVEKFTPHIFYTKDNTSCGPNTLALLTGINPINIEKDLHLKKSSKHVDDDKIIKYLTKRHFLVYPITKAEMTSSRWYIKNSISDKNVILTSMLFTKNMGSWGVIYDQLFYHNFIPSQISPLTLLNHPLLTAYCLWHPSWEY